MLRYIISLVFCWAIVTQAGCVSSISNHEATHIAHRQAVAVDGTIYVVDVKSGAVTKVCPEAVRNAKILGKK